MPKKYCNKCGVELTDENWLPSRRRAGHMICTKCNRLDGRQRRAANPEYARKMERKRSRRFGTRPYSENRQCASFLGVHVAEQVLSQTFKNVKRMPYGNPGYDFICNNNFKIEIKSSCFNGSIMYTGKKYYNWHFKIGKNKIADYFLCLAFDNRKDLNPLHLWLIPSSIINHLDSLSIPKSTLYKWDEYRLDTNKVITCCNTIKKIHAQSKNTEKKQHP